MSTPIEHPPARHACPEPMVAFAVAFLRHRDPLGDPDAAVAPPPRVPWKVRFARWLASLHPRHLWHVDLEYRPPPPMFASVRQFSERDPRTGEPSGEFVAGWRVYPTGVVTGPWFDDPDPDWHVKAGLIRVAPCDRINFAVGPDGLCGLEVYEVSCRTWRLSRAWVPGRPTLGELVGEVRVSTEFHADVDLCLPSGWRRRGG